MPVGRPKWQHADPRRRTGYGTGIVDLTPGHAPRVLEVTEGRTGKVYAAWIAAPEQEWRDAIRVAALDPFRGYATALAAELPHAVRVLDAFHVVKLANTVVDEVRRRVQQHTLGHRGFTGDPLYQARRLLLRGREHLTDPARAKLDAALAAGDPDREVTVAWQVAQAVRAAYHADDLADGRRQTARLLDQLPTCPIPEVGRLGRTQRPWRGEYLAYLDNYRLRLLLHTGVTWQTPTTPRIRSRRPRLVA